MSNTQRIQGYIASHRDTFRVIAAIVAGVIAIFVLLKLTWFGTSIAIVAKLIAVGIAVLVAVATYFATDIRSQKAEEGDDLKSKVFRYTSLVEKYIEDIQRELGSRYNPKVAKMKECLELSKKILGRISSPEFKGDDNDRFDTVSAMEVSLKLAASGLTTTLTTLGDEHLQTPEAMRQVQTYLGESLPGLFKQLSDVYQALYKADLVALRIANKTLQNPDL